MLRLKLIIGVLSLALVTPSLSRPTLASSGPPDSSRLRVRRWTADEGLPQSRVACLTQTRDGYLWLGTWSGLARFNGMAFTLFNKFNTPALPSDAINGLAEDTEGTLWIGTHDGLVRYHDRHFQRVSLSAGLTDQDIPRVAASRNGGVWIQAGTQIARLIDGRIAPGWPIALLGSDARNLFEAPDGRLNIVKEDQWLSLSPLANELRTNYAAPKGSRLLTAVVGSAPNSGWFGTAEGLRHLGSPPHEFGSEPRIDGQPVPLLYRPSTGELWVATETGTLFRFSRTGSESTELDLGPPVCITQDQDGDIWVGCEKGLARVHRQAARTLTTSEGLCDNNVLSVCEGTDGSIWVGTAHGLNCIRGERIVPLQIQEPYIEYADRSLWPRSREL